MPRVDTRARRARPAVRSTAVPVLWVLTLGTLSAWDSDLVESARRADWTTVLASVTEGADVTVTALDGSTALHWASYWDEMEVARRLIERGADPGAANDLGATPLWSAALNGSLDMVRLLLTAGADPDASLLLGETVVMTAARTGSPGVVEALLEAGADPNRRAARGQTALMWAAAQGHSEVVELLIRNGADVHARSDGWSQVMAVPPHSEPENQANVPHGGMTPLLFAARAGDLESVKLLVGAGAEVDAADAWGLTSTVLAAHSGFVTVVEFLMSVGADPNLMGAGFSALHIAAMRRDGRMARALVEGGADPDVPLETWTPTRRASEDWNFHQALVGATPLWIAARFSAPDVMEVLLDRGADARFVHTADYVGSIGAFGAGRLSESKTVLMAALGMGSAGRAWVPPQPHERSALMFDAVRLAVESGADVNATDERGQTALDMAVIMEYGSIAEYLTDHGARRSSDDHLAEPSPVGPGTRRPY